MSGSRETYAAVVALLKAQGLEARVVALGNAAPALTVLTAVGGLALWAINPQGVWAYTLIEEGEVTEASSVAQMSGDLLPAAVSQIIALWPYHQPTAEAAEFVKRLWAEGIAE